MSSKKRSGSQTEGSIDRKPSFRGGPEPEFRSHLKLTTTQPKDLLNASLSGSRNERRRHKDARISLQSYLGAVLYGIDFPHGAELKSQRVSNFLNVPFELERVRNPTLIIFK
jgi:hypothetical protein